MLTTFNTLAGFNPTGLNLAASTLLSRDSILAMFNNLATLSTAKVLTLGATNLAKMTSGEKAIATNKKMDVSLNTHNLFRGRRRVMEHLTKEVFYTIGDINSYTLIADEDYIIVKISDSQALSKQIYLGITDSETNYKAVLISDIPIEEIVIMFYNLILNMWIMGQLQKHKVLSKMPKYITQAEADMILATPQSPIEPLNVTVAVTE